MRTNHEEESRESLQDTFDAIDATFDSFRWALKWAAIMGPTHFIRVLEQFIGMMSTLRSSVVSETQRQREHDHNCSTCALRHICPISDVLGTNEQVGDCSTCADRDDCPGSNAPRTGRQSGMFRPV